MGAQRDRARGAERRLVRGVVEMALALGKQTIAESVTDAATLRVLRDAGVDYAQGYHIGAPRPLEDLLAERRAGR